MRCSSMPWHPSKLFESKDSCTFLPCGTGMSILANWDYIKQHTLSCLFLFFKGVFFKINICFYFKLLFFIFLYYFSK